MHPGSWHYCLSFFFSKWPSFSEPLCDSSAISGSHLPFMCGGPDRITSLSPLPPPHTWDTLAVVCHHNGIQQAFSRGTIAYSPPFSISQVHSQGNKWRDTNAHICIHTKYQIIFFALFCTFGNYHQFSAKKTIFLNLFRFIQVHNYTLQLLFSVWKNAAGV